jgi:2-methylcitrate dehydratase PrpD
VTVAPDLTTKYPGAWPARVRVTLADGTELSGAADYPVGNPENPVPTSQLEEKLTALLAPTAWSDDAAARALAALRSLDTCDDIADVFSAFGATPATPTVSR